MTTTGLAPGVAPDPPRSDAATILVVDDQHANRLAMQALLEPLGRRVVLAESGEEALRILLTERVALILLDVQMPGMDGFETARYIRGRLRTRRIPIIFVTAISTDSKHIFDGYAAGAVDYMLKPIDPIILRSKVSVFVELFETNSRLQRQAESQGVHESLELAQRAGRSGVWDWDIGEGTAYWSPEYAAIVGLPDDATAATFWLATVDPRDRDRVRTRFRRLLDSGEAWDEEFRVVHPEQGVRWVAARGKLFRGARAEPERFTGIVVDVTERRHDVDRLRRLHAATAALSAAVTPSEVLERVLDHSLSAVEAAATWLWLPDGVGGLVPAGVAPPGATAGHPGDGADLEHARAALGGGLPVAWRADGRWQVAVPIGAGGLVAGVLCLALESPVRPDAEEMGFLAALGSLCGQAVDRARLLDDEREARRRTEALQAATAALAAAVTAREVAEAIVQQALLAFGASSAGVRLIASSTGTLDTVAVAGFPDPAARPLGASALDERSPTTDCVRAHEPLFLETAADLEARYPGAFGDGGWEAHEALAAVPLSMEGRVIGVVGVRFDGPRAFPVGDRESLTAFGRLAALSAARAMLQEAEERRREHTSLVAEVSLALDADMGARERLARLTQLLVPRVADACFIEVEGEDGALEAVALAPETPEAEATARYVREVLASRAPEGLDGHRGVVDGGQSFLVEDLGDEVLDGHLERTDLHGAIAGRLRRSPPRSVLVAPIGARGRTTGTLVLVLRDAARRYDGNDLRLAEDIGRRAGLALDNARLYEAQAGAAITLQQSLLPPLPAIRELALAARYIAAAAHTEAGGDWYEAVEGPEQRVILAVGDVVGHGIESAAVMGQLRSAMRAYALAGLSPGAALEQLSRFASSVEGAAVSTAVCVEVDLSAGTLRYACAGHPPALLVRGDGGATFLDGVRGVALGVVDRPYAEGVEAFAPGDALVLYTDGLVERRGEILDEGLARLAAEASRAVDGGSAPAQLCDLLVAGLVDEGSIRDDVAVLLAVREAPVAPLRLNIPAAPDRLSEARRAVREWLAGAPLEERARQDALLACGEACANSVEHAYLGGGAGRLEIELWLERDRALRLTVRDDGRWRPPPSDPGPRGRGIGIMRAVMDRVDVRRGDDGTEVRMVLGAAGRRRWPGGRDGPARPRPVWTSGRPGASLRVDPARGGPARCVLTGDVAAERAAAARDEILRAADGRAEILVDLSGVGYLDSTGTRMLLDVAATLATRGGRLRVLAPAGTPARRVLDLCRIEATSALAIEGHAG